MTFADLLAESSLYTLPALGFWALLFVLERRWPALPLPRTRLWWTRLAVIQLAMMLLGWVGSVTWIVVLRRWSLVTLPIASPLLAGAVAYVAAAFVFYGWHRLRHESNLCWRLFHQLHHSPRRIEAATAFYNHPLEIVASSVVLAGVCYTGLGLGPRAYAWCALFTSLVGLFYHSNLRTPHALAYVVQTPDLHRVHHQTGAHRGNYADLPVIDLLFGTFVHPATFDGRTGFDGERELRFGAILACRDVHAAEGAGGRRV